MKILVTGTAGFIGYHLTKKLLERGDEVIGLDNINGYYDVNLKYARLAELGIDQKNIKKNIRIVSGKYNNLKFVKANIEDSKTINKIFEAETLDAVCNLAAQAGVRHSIENPHAYIQSNIVGFMNILEACRYNSVKNLSYASSSSVYGLNKSQPFKVCEHSDHPVSLYAASKKSNEMMAHAYSHLYNISTTGLRFFTVYGPWGRPDMAPMLFADAILNDREIKVFNHGDMSRDFTYIDDIVSGVIKVIDNSASPSLDFDAYYPNSSISSAPYRIYNIGSNRPTRLMDFIGVLENSIGKKAEKKFMDIQAGDVLSTYADTEGLFNDFNYKPNTSLARGISEFVAWYRNFYL